MPPNNFLGMRVLRGPDWIKGEVDGGEGHLGTVVKVKAEEGTAEVVWDNGHVTTCRVGKEGKHDLRIYDNAPAGECVSRGVVCQGCRNSSIYGTSWRCSTCSNLHLCSRCYHLGVHPLSHHFLRQEGHGKDRVAVGTRSDASKIPVFGIFPEARVARGHDWEYGDADGGSDSGGVVVEVVSPESGSARNAVRVSWDSGQSLQHRLGLHGKVDLVCTEEAPGPACYVSHLPVLLAECLSERKRTEVPLAQGEVKVDTKDAVKEFVGENAIQTTKAKVMLDAEAGMHSSSHPTSSGAVKDEGAQIKSDTLEGASADGRRLHSPADTSVSVDRPESETGLGTTGMAVAAKNEDKKDKPSTDNVVPAAKVTDDTTREVTLDTEGEIGVGDRVEVGVDFDTFRDIQSQTASWTDNMAKCLGRTGVVKSVTATGEMKVDFEGLTWKINGICLKKSSQSALSPPRSFKTGDTVRIISDLELLREQQKGHGEWNSDMALTASKVGKVMRITAKGDPVVHFGQVRWIFSPSSCSLAPGCVRDFLYEDHNGEDLGGLMQGLRKEVANLLAGHSSTPQKNDLEQGQSHAKLAAFFDAVATGDTTKAACFLDRSPEMARETISGATALDYAVHCRQEAAVRLLVAKGADINRGDNKENTPLLRAINIRNCALTRTLVELGADINLSNEDGQTPLHMAVAVDCPDIINLLLQQGASVNRRNLQGDTPLFQAIGGDDLDSPAVEALLSAENLDLKLRNKSDFSILHFTAYKDRPRAAERILARDPDLAGLVFKEERYTVFHVAVANNHVEVLRQLVKAKHHIDGRNKFNQTALHIACDGGFLDCAVILVENGADVNAGDVDMDTPLHECFAPSGNQHSHKTGLGPEDVGVAVARYLIQQGARVDIRNKKGITALDTAPESVRDELRQLANQRRDQKPTILQGDGTSVLQPSPTSQSSSPTALCTTCQQRNADVIFLPCAHMVVCRQCARSAKSCMDCGNDVRKIVDTDGNQVGLETPSVSSHPSEVTPGVQDGKTFQEDVGLKAGDRVVVGVDEETFKLIQTQSGCWDARMTECLGRIGVVKAITAAGEIEVDFAGDVWKISPISLTKEIPTTGPAVRKFKVGDTVRILSDLEQLKRQQEGHGDWVNDMAEAAGKVGTVKTINERGDLVVTFGQNYWIFNPESCLPAPGCTTDFIPIEGADDVPEETMQQLHKMIADVCGGDLARMFGGLLGQPAVPMRLSGLFAAVAIGDTAKTASLLEDCPGLVRETIGGATALHYAVQNGQEASVRLLVAKGADINKGDNDEDTPLHLTVHCKNHSMAKVLLELGANVHSRNEHARTPLLVASALNCVDQVRLFLHHGASVNAQDKDGQTPLYIALANTDTSPALIDTLLAVGDLDLKLTTRQNATALHAAAHFNRPGELEKILARDPGLVHSPMEKGSTPLHLAAQNDNTEAMRILLKAKALVNARGETGLTPLHHACSGDSMAGARLLLEKGADINAADDDGNTPLHLCVGSTVKSTQQVPRDKGLELAKFLIQQGARTDSLNKKGRTPIDMAPAFVAEQLKRYLREKDLTPDKNQDVDEISNESPSASSASPSDKCITCHQREADVIFLPCAHKLFCRQCAGSTTSCRECGGVVVGRVDTEGNPVEVSTLSTGAVAAEETAGNQKEDCKVQ